MSKLYKKIAPFLATSFTDIGFHKTLYLCNALSTARQPRQCERRLHNT